MLSTKRMTLEEYPELDFGEYLVEVEKGEEEKIPPYIGVGVGVWKVTWWGQRPFFGCWRCLREGHQGWQCKEEVEKEMIVEEKVVDEEMSKKKKI